MGSVYIHFCITETFSKETNRFVRVASIMIKLLWRNFHWLLFPAHTFGATFIWLSKVIRASIGFSVSFVVGPKKLVPHTRPIRCKTKINDNFPALGRFAWFNLGSPWFLRDFSFFSDWLCWRLWFWFYDTQLRNAL